MPDYNLKALSNREFEHLIQALAKKVIAVGVTPFGDGPDGGREASFTGEMDFPSAIAPWNGYLVMQCKYRMREGTGRKPDTDWALAELEKEMRAYLPDARVAARKVPDYYIYVVNVNLTAAQNRGGRDRVEAGLTEWARTLGIKDFKVWDADEINRFLDSALDIVASYSALITPSTVLATTLEHVKRETKVLDELAKNMFTGGGALDRVLSGQFDKMAGSVSEMCKERILTLKQLWQIGKRQTVLDGLLSLQTHIDSSEAIAPNVKVEFYHFFAFIDLCMHRNLDFARELLSRARALNPDANSLKIRAIIALIETGLDEALKLLSSANEPYAANMAAKLYLQRGDVDSAERMIARFCGDANNPETLCNRAWIALIKKNLADARLLCKQAQDLQPEWIEVRTTSAAIDYFAAVSRAIHPLHAVGWPEPIDPVYIKRDSASQECLRQAESALYQLVEEPELLPDERSILRTWLIASLVYQRSKGDHAKAVCETMLRGDPGDFRAVIWAARYRWGIDLQPSADLLRSLLQDGHAEITHLGALFCCLMERNAHADAKELFHGNPELRRIAGGKPIWFNWLANLALQSEDHELAQSLVDQIGQAEPSDDLTGISLQLQAELTEDWSKFIGFMEERWERQHDYEDLWMLCKFKSDRADWAGVVAHAEDLVLGLATEGALRFSASAAYNDGNVDLCLKLLDDYRSFFEGGDFGVDIRRMRIYCYSRQGKLKQASDEAEELIRREHAVHNLLIYAHVNWLRGDLHNCATAARIASKDFQLTALQALQLANMIFPQYSEFAIELCRYAEKLGVPDEAVILAIDLAYRQGRDAEINALLMRLPELAEKKTGQVFSFNPKDLPEYFESVKQRNAKLNALYNTGSISLHYVAAALRIPLVELFHITAQENEASRHPAVDPILFFEHGGRRPIQFTQTETSRLRVHLDITSLVLAEHLGLLDKVEAAWPRLFVPLATVPALQEMRRELEFHQPTRLAALPKVIKYVEMQLINVVDLPDIPESDTGLAEDVGYLTLALLIAADRANGHIIDFTPHKKAFSDENVEMPEKYSARLANIRNVIDALRKYLPLSSKAYEAANISLGDLAAEPALPVLLSPGTSIFASYEILVQLEDAGLLEAFCRKYRVCISNIEYQREQNHYASWERKRRETVWVDRLISRLNSGFDNSKYEVYHEDASVNTHPDKQSSSATMQCHNNMAGFRGQPDDVIWVDDRLINGFRMRKNEEIPIITVLEVMAILKQVGQLSSDEYFQRLYQLRAANVRYIPFSEDEILYHVMQAPILEDALQETVELETLRKYAAACFLQSEFLQRPQNNAKGEIIEGEVPFVQAFIHAVDGALLRAWQTDSEKGVLNYPRAEWVARNLYVDTFALAAAAGRVLENKTIDQYQAMSLAGLLMSAARMYDPISENNSLRQRYIEWLNATLLSARIAADGEQLVEGIADILKASILNLRDSKGGGKARRLYRYVWSHYFTLLPSPLKATIGKDAPFLAAIGVTYSPSVSVGQLRFMQSVFFRGLRSAIKNGETSISQINGPNQVVIRREADDDNMLSFSCINPSDGRKYLFKDPVAVFLLDDLDLDDPCVAKGLYYADVPKAEQRNALASIQRATSPVQRMKRIREWMDTSSVASYQDLDAALNQKSSTPYEGLLPPPWRSLMRYLRIASAADAAGNVVDELQRGVAEIYADYGIHEVWQRYAGLPLEFMAFLKNSGIIDSQKDRRKVIKEILREPQSPVSVFHLMRLASELSDESSALNRLANRLAMHCMSDEYDKELRAYLQILRFTGNAVAAYSDCDLSMPEAVAAAVWTHSHKLWTLLRANGAPCDWIEEYFGSNIPRPMTYYYDRSSDWWQDISNPRRANALPIIVAGLAYAFNYSDAIVKSGLRTTLQNRLFRNIEGKLVPDLSLIQDSSLGWNSLGSFFGVTKEVQWRTFVGAEGTQMLSSAQLSEYVGKDIESLISSPAETHRWKMLWLISNDLPFYAQHCEGLKTAIIASQIVAKWEEDPDAAIAGLLRSASHAASAQDLDLARVVEDQIIGIGTRIARNAYASGDGASYRIGSEPEIPHLGPLLEVAIYLANLEREDSNRIREFVRILDRLAYAEPLLRPTIGAVVHNMTRMLPTTLSIHFSHLAFRLKAG
jgi:hypothetical protein